MKALVEGLWSTHHQMWAKIQAWYSTTTPEQNQ